MTLTNGAKVGPYEIVASLAGLGTHSVIAQYERNGSLAASESPAVTINVSNADFSLAATPSSATVMAGQSAQFIPTVTPVDGFADNFTFSCSPVTGISRTFNTAVVTPSNGTASTTLTVITSACVSRYGLLRPGLIGPGALLVNQIQALFTRHPNITTIWAHLG
jgi:hypothetical protein